MEQRMYETDESKSLLSTLENLQQVTE